MIFIIHDKKSNQQMVINPRSLNRIYDNMQKLERLHYSIALDQNIGYYTIEVSPFSQVTTTIVTEFGKLSYSRLPMGIFTLGDTLL